MCIIILKIILLSFNSKIVLTTHAEIFRKFQREKNNSEIRLVLKFGTFIVREFIFKNSLFLWNNVKWDV